jgi:hypothetical protein
MSSADYQRRWRASKGARTGQPGRAATQPHGTPAAFRRHKRAGEDPCEPCRRAESERQAELYRARRERLS